MPKYRVLVKFSASKARHNDFSCLAFPLSQHILRSKFLPLAINEKRPRHFQCITRRAKMFGNNPQFLCCYKFENMNRVLKGLCPSIILHSLTEAVTIHDNRISGTNDYN